MIDAVPAFEEFAHSRAPHLFRSASLLTGSREEAEDLVQETLAKVYVRMHRRLGPRLDNPAAYAQVVLARTFVSSRRRRSSSELPYADPPQSVAGDHAELTDLRISLQEALGQLPPVDRAVLVLRYFEDLSVNEVAHLLDLSPGAVKNRSMRALARMRERTPR
jgi:RNA polymerase sigma-70 factor (sigma-E family)